MAKKKLNPVKIESGLRVSGIYSIKNIFTDLHNLFSHETYCPVSIAVFAAAEDFTTEVTSLVARIVNEPSSSDTDILPPEDI